MDNICPSKALCPPKTQDPKNFVIVTIIYYKLAILSHYDLGPGAC
jgi:hypothetical protein